MDSINSPQVKNCTTKDTVRQGSPQAENAEAKPQSLEDKATDILLETLLECGVKCDLSRDEIKKRMGIILKDVQINKG